MAIPASYNIQSNITAVTCNLKNRHREGKKLCVLRNRRSSPGGVKLVAKPVPVPCATIHDQKYCIHESASCLRSWAD